MEKNNQLNPKEDQQLWDDILTGKKSDIVTPLLVNEEQEMWENILSGIRAREHKKKLRRIRTYSVIAAITLIFIIGGIIGYTISTKPYIYIAQAANENVQLADGSWVTLSKGAKLTVEKSFPADTREVQLEGNAIFRVSKYKQHPFIVHGNGYETKVLGTVFKISQTGKTFNVDLYEGKVLVFRKGHSKEPIAIQPKQTFTNYGSPNVASVTETSELQTPAAKKKTATLIFNDCLLSDAIRVIEKTYRIKVSYPVETEEAKISVALSNATVDAFLQSLAMQLNLNIIQNNDSTFELEK